jgi:hypothetical protein
VPPAIVTRLLYMCYSRMCRLSGRKGLGLQHAVFSPCPFRLCCVLLAVSVCSLTDPTRLVRSPTSFAGSAFHSLLFPKSTYSSQLTPRSLSFYEDQLDQCRGEPAQFAENKTLAPVRIVRSNADHGESPRTRQVLARDGFFTTGGASRCQHIRFVRTIPVSIHLRSPLSLAVRLKTIRGYADRSGYTKLLSLPRTSLGAMRWCATVSLIWSTDCENAVSTRGESEMTRGRRAVLHTEAQTIRSRFAATSLTMWCCRAGVPRIASILESSARSVGRTIMCTRKRPIG